MGGRTVKRPPCAAPAHRREAGFALLLVLWSLVLLSLIFSQVLSSGRSEAQLAFNLREAAMAESVADGAVQNAIFHLLQGAQHLPAHQAYRLSLPGGVADIRTDNLAGSVNPNTASPPFLEAMLQLCGNSANEASVLTQSILDWRAPLQGPDTSINAYRAAGLAYAPPHAAFQTSDEIGLVLGITPTLRDCLLPHLSVYSEEDEPLPGAADPFVLKAMRMVATESGAPMPTESDEEGDITVSVTVAAAVPGGGRFSRRAVVRLTPDDAGSPFRILDWETV